MQALDLYTISNECAKNASVLTLYAEWQKLAETNVTESDYLFGPRCPMHVHAFCSNNTWLGNLHQILAIKVCEHTYGCVVIHTCDCSFIQRHISDAKNIAPTSCGVRPRCRTHTNTVTATDRLSPSRADTRSAQTILTHQYEQSRFSSAAHKGRLQVDSQVAPTRDSLQAYAPSLHA
jgi:hypothetical protein